MTTTQSEKSFQSQVVKLAKLYQWTLYHTYDSRRSNAGFPDLVLIKGPRIVVVELKSDKGKLRPEQEDWLAKFRATPAEVYVWRPSDWDEVQRVLGA